MKLKNYLNYLFDIDGGVDKKTVSGKIRIFSKIFLLITNILIALGIVITFFMMFLLGNPIIFLLYIITGFISLIGAYFTHLLFIGFAIIVENSENQIGKKDDNYDNMNF